MALSWEVCIALSWVVSLDSCCWRRDSNCSAGISSSRLSQKIGIECAIISSRSSSLTTFHPPSKNCILVPDTARMGSAHPVLRRTFGGFLPRRSSSRQDLPTPAAPLMTHFILCTSITPFFMASAKYCLDSVEEQTSVCCSVGLGLLVHTH